MVIFHDPCKTYPHERLSFMVYKGIGKDKILMDPWWDFCFFCDCSFSYSCETAVWIRWPHATRGGWLYQLPREVHLSRLERLSSSMPWSGYRSQTWRCAETAMFFLIGHNMKKQRIWMSKNKFDLIFLGPERGLKDVQQKCVQINV